MINFEATLYNITFYDDAYRDPDSGLIIEGGNGTLISFDNICSQYNLTEDEEPEVIGPTPPVELKPKVRQPLHQ